MKIKILTLFPEMFGSVFHHSILKRAIEQGVCSVELVDMRNYSLDKFHHVDDTPYGGGAGMVLACDVVDRAISSNATNQAYKVLLTPQGKTYSDQLARTLAEKEELVLICGHYEGFDERIRSFVDEEISIGDYVLTGGEPAAMVICDSVIRLLDHAIKRESHEEDSFADGLLEYPQFTRPVEYKGMKVPEVLLQGNHQLINQYRKKESLRKTYLRRRDLLENYPLSLEEQQMLDEVIAEYKESTFNEMIVKAKAFLYREACPLTLSLFQYHFEAGTKAAVLRILSSYQNRDGGFGHALGFKGNQSYSNLLDTAKSIEILKEIEWSDAHHPIVKGILKYLSSDKNFNTSEVRDVTYPTAHLIAFILEYANPISKVYQKAFSIAENVLSTQLNEECATLGGSLYLYQIVKKENLFADKLNDFKSRIVVALKSVVSQHKEDELGYFSSFLFKDLDNLEIVQEIEKNYCELPLRQQKNGFFERPGNEGLSGKQLSQATLEKLVYYQKISDWSKKS